MTPKSWTRWWIAPAAIALIAATCPDSPSAPELSASGKWSAPVSGLVMSMTLAQSGTSITGSGTATDPTDPPPGIFSVTGSVSGSSVTLTIQIQPQQFMGQTVDANKAPMQFTGTLTATTMNGALNGGGPPAVSNLAANFTKQP